MNYRLRPAAIAAGTADGFQRIRAEGGERLGKFDHSALYPYTESETDFKKYYLS